MCGLGGGQESAKRPRILYMMRRRKFAQVLVAGTVAPTLFAWREPVAEAAGISKSWDLCAASATIVVGTLHVPVEELQAARGGKGRYLRPKLDVAETLKGERSDAVVITFYSEDRPYAPQSATLLALDGQQVVAFLESAKDPENEKPANYFAGSTPDALRAASSAGVADLRAEVARQDRVLHTWRPHPDWPHWAEVKRLIGKTSRKKLPRRRSRNSKSSAQTPYRRWSISWTTAVRSVLGKSCSKIRRDSSRARGITGRSSSLTHLQQS